MRTALFWAVVGAAHAQVAYQDLLRPNPADWLTYSGAYHSQRHSALKQIHAGNVRSLSPKWIFHMPGASRLESVPIVHNGVLYILQPNEVYALDSHTRRRIW